MADLKDFFRNTEIEIDTDRKTQEAQQQKEKQAAFLLKSLLETEWKQVAGIMKSETVDEIFDGKRFFWNSECTSVTLGEATLTLRAVRKPYEHLTYTSTLGIISGRPAETILTPCLVGETLGWQIYGATGKKLTTEELAETLVKQLVNLYKIAQSNGVKGSA